jgi:hypothetical protein
MRLIHDRLFQHCINLARASSQQHSDDHCSNSHLGNFCPKAIPNSSKAWYCCAYCVDDVAPPSLVCETLACAGCIPGRWRTVAGAARGRSGRHQRSPGTSRAGLNHIHLQAMFSLVTRTLPLYDACSTRHCSGSLQYYCGWRQQAHDTRPAIGDALFGSLVGTRAR